MYVKSPVRLYAFDRNGTTGISFQKQNYYGLQLMKRIDKGLPRTFLYYVLRNWFSINAKLHNVLLILLQCGCLFCCSILVSLSIRKSTLLNRNSCGNQVIFAEVSNIPSSLNETESLKALQDDNGETANLVAQIPTAFKGLQNLNLNLMALYL